MIIGKTSLAFDSAANGVFELFDQYPYVILWDFIVYLYAKITMTTMATNSKRGTAWRHVPLCFLGVVRIAVLRQAPLRPGWGVSGWCAPGGALWRRNS